MNKIKISILICTLNEEKAITERIKNILSLENNNNAHIEAIILDNNSTDRTKEIVNEFASMNDKIKYINTGSIGKCGSLYFAFEQVVTDYFLLTDANVYFKKNTINTLIKSITSSNFPDLIIGNTRIYSSFVQGINFFNSSLNFPIRFAIEKFFKFSSGANGACYALRSSSIDGITKYRTTRNDDFVISVYASKSNKICFNKDLMAFELEELEMQPVFQRKYRDALGHADALKWLLGNRDHFPKFFKAVFFRLFYWTIPSLFILFILFFMPLNYFLIIFVLTIAFQKTRELIIKILALYLGLFKGIFFTPKTSWDTKR